MYSERRSSVDNDNFGTLIEQVQATAFVAHPYQIPTIGWPSDIEGWKVADLEAYYTPVLRAQQRGRCSSSATSSPPRSSSSPTSTSRRIPAQPAPPAVTTREPPQLGERRLRIERDAQTPLLAMAWHAAAAPDRADARAWRCCCRSSATATRRACTSASSRRSRPPSQVGTSLDQGFDPGLAWVYAVVPPGGDVARTETADRRGDRAPRAGRADADRARQGAQPGTGAGSGAASQTISGKAEALGEYEVFHGDYRKLFDAPAAYESITADDVKQARRARCCAARTARSACWCPADRSRRRTAGRGELRR